MATVQIGDGDIYARLLSLHPKAIDLSLERLKMLLGKLGHPELSLPRVVHVAGTNGKGSTTAFCRAMLEAAGYRVHVYTSPHLVRFSERVRLAGTLVPEAVLLQTLEEVERVNAGAPITFFEVTTAAGLLLFSRTPADFLVLEVGLGGRLDATNVVDQPELSIITPVSMDHEKFLGDRIEMIAGEKAGIIKAGRPTIVSRQTPDVLNVIAAEGRLKQAALHISGSDWTSREVAGRLSFTDRAGTLDLPAPRLLGRHQFENAGAAIAAMRLLGEASVPVAAISAGLLNVEWPARLQRLTSGPLVARVPAGAELWLDGGHNPGAGEVIAEAMAAFHDRDARPLILICGMLSTKDATGFFRPFARLKPRVMTITIPGESAAIPADELAQTAGRAGLQATSHASLDEALGATGTGTPRILICGSLYLAGRVLAANGGIA
jgi:dihydrofolate synthase / folylpolyglutamate synthase